jgi:hypothetical protein
MEIGAGAISAGSGGAVTVVGSLTTGGARGSAVFLGVSSVVEVTGVTAIVGSEVVTEELLVAAAGCPQFVQKLVSGSSFDPQFVQKAVGDEGAETVSISTGAGSATAASSSIFAGWGFSFAPHSVQKTESGSPCAPQEEQTGRATVTAALGCTAVGIGLPHDVQKLADSSTRLLHDVQNAIHFAPGIRTASLLSTTTKDLDLLPCRDLLHQL